MSSHRAARPRNDPAAMASSNQSFGEKGTGGWTDCRHELPVRWRGGELGIFTKSPSKNHRSASPTTPALPDRDVSMRSCFGRFVPRRNHAPEHQARPPGSRSKSGAPPSPTDGAGPAAQLFLGGVRRSQTHRVTLSRAEDSRRQSAPFQRCRARVRLVESNPCTRCRTSQD